MAESQMDPRPSAASSKSLDDQSKSRWMQDKEAHVLEVKMSEFKKEEVRVQIDSLGTLRIIGERATDHKPIRFRQTYRIPDHSKRSEIKAKFENGVLRVFVPFRDPPARSLDVRPDVKTPGATNLPTSDPKQAATQENQLFSPAATCLSSAGTDKSAGATDQAGNRPMVAMTTYKRRRGANKLMNRIGFDLKDERKRVVSVGIISLMVAVVVAWFFTDQSQWRWMVERNW